MDKVCNLAAKRGYKGLVMDMVDVNGKNAHPIYSFLKVSSGDTSNIKWNFEKFLIRPDGTVFK